VRQTAERAARADREATSQETIRGVVRSREQEAELTKQLTNHLINIGYRVLAVQLHPDKPGGSTKAMARLNKVKDMLKKAAGAVHEEIQ
jgi:curved DNA-binding protein CbpA